LVSGFPTLFSIMLHSSWNGQTGSGAIARLAFLTISAKGTSPRALCVKPFDKRSFEVGFKLHYTIFSPDFHPFNENFFLFYVNKGKLISPASQWLLKRIDTAKKLTNSGICRYGSKASAYAADAA
jgi:hypothetical protein